MTAEVLTSYVNHISLCVIKTYFINLANIYRLNRLIDPDQNLRNLVRAHAQPVHVCECVRLRGEEPDRKDNINKAKCINFFKN